MGSSKLYRWIWGLSWGTRCWYDEYGPEKTQRWSVQHEQNSDKSILYPMSGKLLIEGVLLRENSLDVNQSMNCVSRVPIQRLHNHVEAKSTQTPSPSSLATQTFQNWVAGIPPPGGKRRKGRGRTNQQNIEWRKLVRRIQKASDIPNPKQLKQQSRQRSPTEEYVKTKSPAWSHKYQAGWREKLCGGVGQNPRCVAWGKQK